MPKLVKSLLLLFLTWLISLGVTISITHGQENQKVLNPPHKLEGLNAPVVLSVIKDVKGFMWFLTQYGLVRYDGYNFKTYNNRPEDSTSMPGISGISKMIEGADGKIWIGTAQNLLVEFNPVTETFISYPMDSTISKNYRNWISTMYIDHSGNLWLGLQYEGFYRFNPQVKTFKLYRQQTIEPIHNIDYILSFLEMEDDNLLVGTRQGLYMLDRKTDSIQPFIPAVDLPESFSTARFSSLIRDRNGLIWIGSSLGLFQFNPGTGELLQFVHEPDNLQSISSNIIQRIYANPLDGGQTLWIIVRAGTGRAFINKVDINSGKLERFVHPHEKPINVYDYYLDESGLLWMASDNQGVFFIDLKDNPFQHFTISTGTSEQESYSGSAFYTDSNGDFWVGTRQGELFHYNKSGNLKKKYKNLPGSRSYSPSMIYSILEDSKNNLWISYWTDGLYRYNRKSGIFKKFDMQHPKAKLPYSMSSELLEDTFGRMWVGSMAGPFFTEVGQEVIENLNRVDFPLLDHSLVRSLCQDNSGTVWVATSRDGLFCLPPDKRGSLQFTNYRHNPLNKGSISSDIIYSVHCSNDGALWVGTGNGLSRFDPETETFDYFNTKNGFDAFFVYCVRTDDSGNVWVTTEKGLARFIPNADKGRKFKLFTTSDGLPFKKIYPYHFDKGKDGRFYLGGEKGFGLGYFSFHPDSIKDNILIPPVIITGFEVKNKTIVIDTAISYKKQIDLQYNQNFISFEFASLDYNEPEKNQYAYKLEGLDEDWFYSGNRHVANYTGLPPGSYLFRVKASNNDGYWNEEGTSILLVIAPPPWKTSWAYLAYIVAFGTIIYLIIRYYLRRQQLLLQLNLEHLEAEKFKEVNALKSKFFANISHEFRTPLTLILGPLKNLVDSKANPEEKKELLMARRNALKLQQLINQLLELSKIEAGKTELNCKNLDFAEWLKTYIQSFESLARQRNIELRFNTSHAKIIAYFDIEKMSQVINNLLSNAFKFSRSGGKIYIELTKENILNDFEMKVRDTGKGIPAKSLPFVFNRFYQADNSTLRKHKGTGIGLSLVKEIVELHGGSVSAESELGVGTTFCIRLPLGKEQTPSENIPDNDIDVILEPILHLFDDPQKTKPQNLDAVSESMVLPVMLIVEDNTDMRTYIRDHFLELYQVMEAENGKTGLEIAIENLPDIIISDVMMPEMDGNEMTAILKTDQRTSHIPVILLTARSSGADKIEGLETGADDFLIKPFDGKELQVRVKNLVDQRQLLREHFKKEFSHASTISKTGLKSMDQQFLQKALKIIEVHISESEFSVEQFAEMMALSRVQLHRKMKAISDLSAGDFIKSIRLQKAADMLRSRSGNIADIAYAVGFSNPSWFSEAFKKHFGVLPSEYTKN